MTPDAAINVQSGVLGLESAADLAGSDANTASVAAGATFDLNAVTIPVNWTLALADGAHLAVRSGATNQNLWAGPVTLTGGQAILDGASSYAHSTISGLRSPAAAVFSSPTAAIPTCATPPTPSQAPSSSPTRCSTPTRPAPFPPC